MGLKTNTAPLDQDNGIVERESKKLHATLVFIFRVYRRADGTEGRCHCAPRRTRGAQCKSSEDVPRKVMKIAIFALWQGNYKQN